MNVVETRGPAARHFDIPLRRRKGVAHELPGPELRVVVDQQELKHGRARLSRVPEGHRSDSELSPARSVSVRAFTDANDAAAFSKGAARGELLECRCSRCPRPSRSPRSCRTVCVRTPGAPARSRLRDTRLQHAPAPRGAGSARHCIDLREGRFGIAAARGEQHGTARRATPRVLQVRPSGSPRAWPAADDR